MKSSRAVAALATHDVLFGCSPTSIDYAIERYHARDDWSFLRAVVIGSIRYWRRNEWILSRYIKKKLPKKEHLVHALLLNSCHELMEELTPDYAIVNESVKAIAELNKPWAKRFLNGILRNIVRHKAELRSTLENQSLGVQSSHPDWFIEQIRLDWPDQMTQILNANNTQAPLTVRLKSTVARDKYVSDLAVQDIACIPTTVSRLGVTIRDKVEVENLPGYVKGEFYVQDEAPQLLINLLDVSPHARILDACAAPGGKTSLVLERYPDVQMTAIDVSESRCRRLTQNLTRLRLGASVYQADVRDVDSWWDGNLFDVILLDVPCSASGVIRRHPEIKWGRSPDDLKQLITIQRELIECSWNLLVQGGVLIYSTCSIFIQENDGQIEWFLSRQPKAKVETIDCEMGRRSKFGWQHFPTVDKNDGFFYSRLRKPL